jgi:hypothetical protein
MRWTWRPPLRLQVVADYERLSAVQAAGCTGRGRASGLRYPGFVAVGASGLMLLVGWRSRAMLDCYSKMAAADRAADAHRCLRARITMSG